MSDTRPNILVVMSDHEQAQVHDPAHPCRLPNSQRLAENGIRFSETYCSAPHCCPSRASFMTGLHPSGHGVFNNVTNETAIHEGLKEGVVTFSEIMRDAGYDLAYTGKWHVTHLENPGERGWRELPFGCGKDAYHANSWESYRKRVADGETDPTERHRGQILRPGWGPYTLYGSRPDGDGKPYQNTGDYLYTKAACEELPKLASGDKPWFLYVGFGGPHDPYIIPETYAKMYNPADVKLPENFSDTLEDKPVIYQRLRRQIWGQLSEDEYREAIAHFWGYCTMLDDMFGEILQALEATGQAENTLVIRTSDHADYVGAHGLFTKGIPSFREAYNIPCVVQWPKCIAKRGSVVDEFIDLVDFAPTFLELAGCEDLESMHGRSFVPMFEGSVPADWPDARFTQMNAVELYYTQRAVQTKTHKYVFNGFDWDELYDLEKDPHEMKNVIDDPAYANVLKDLMRRYWRHVEATGDMRNCPYPPVALEPLGPLHGIKED